MKKYIFLCMNAILDCKVLEFENDEEAIEFGSNYEAKIYEVELVFNKFINNYKPEIKRLVYDPYDCFK